MGKKKEEEGIRKERTARGSHRHPERERGFELREERSLPSRLITRKGE